MVDDAGIIQQSKITGSKSAFEKIKKGTKICTPCARKDELTNIEKIKIHNDTIVPKSPNIPNELNNKKINK